jgi:hypothetical protein
MSVCIAAVANSGNQSRKAASTPAPTTKAAGTPTPKAPSTPVPAATPNPAGTCLPQPCANDNYGWIVTVANLRYDAPSNNQFERPETSNVYVTMDVTFTNKTTQERHADPFQFVLLDGAGVKHSTAILGPCESWSAVNVTPSATFGPKCLQFEAAAGKPAGLVLVWTPSLGDYRIKLS